MADSSESEEEADSGGEVADEAPAPPRRGSRVRAAISYAAMSSGDDGEEDAEDDGEDDDEADASGGDDGSDFE